MTASVADRREIALVDVCVNTAMNVGSRALWEVATLRELYCTFAEPHAIGLSSIIGQVRPTSRRDAHGVRAQLDTSAEQHVLAAIAPGVVVPVGVREVQLLAPGETVTSRVAAGTVAVDGERELEFGPRSPVTVTLTRSGPHVVDVRAVMAAAADHGLLFPVRPDDAGRDGHTGEHTGGSQ